MDCLDQWNGWLSRGRVSVIELPSTGDELGKQAAKQQVQGGGMGGTRAVKQWGQHEGLGWLRWRATSNQAGLMV